LEVFASLRRCRPFRAAPQRFDAVLSDESMPELTGTELAREIALLRPDMPIVLMSGFGGAQLHALRHLAECLERVFSA
jgi:CheY-like chemotaxis protein